MAVAGALFDSDEVRAVTELAWILAVSVVVIGGIAWVIMELRK